MVNKMCSLLIHAVDDVHDDILKLTKGNQHWFEKLQGR